MTNDTQSLTDLERRLGHVFTAGLTVSAASLVCGLILYLVDPGAAPAPWFLSAGLMVLMATPLLRVVVSLAEYVRIRDWFFVMTTVAVLAELSVTIVYALTQR
jgi:uncharacterized membrane protein